MRYNRKRNAGKYADYPTVKELAKALEPVLADAKDLNEGEMEYDEEEDEYIPLDEPIYIDVRLQVHDGWALRTGPSDYDQDHRGYWGVGSVVGPDMNMGNLISVANEHHYT